MPGGEFPTEVPRTGGDFRQFLAWRRQRKGLVREHERRGEELPRLYEGDLDLLRSADDAILWAGHASVLARLDGRTILADPVWSRRVAYVVKRMTPAAPDWRHVPTPDIVAISHNHYDHLDVGTIRRLRRQTSIVVPKGVGAWFRRRRFENVFEFDHWETRDVSGLAVTFVPSRHFSGRTLWDRNKSLFGGWIIEGRRHRIYHSGDTGWFDGFAAIGDRFRGLDVACLPIGAYEPRWFMSPVHVDPDEAGRAFLAVGAKRLLPIHWGTFRLSDEAMDDPPKRLRSFLGAEGVDLTRLLLPLLGEPIRLD